jgi:hypothetical protein
MEVLEILCDHLVYFMVNCIILHLVFWYSLVVCDYFPIWVNCVKKNLAAMKPMTMGSTFCCPRNWIGRSYLDMSPKICRPVKKCQSEKKHWKKWLQFPCRRSFFFAKKRSRDFSLFCSKHRKSLFNESRNLDSIFFESFGCLDKK